MGPKPSALTQAQASSATPHSSRKGAARCSSTRIELMPPDVHRPEQHEAGKLGPVHADPGGHQVRRIGDARKDDQDNGVDRRSADPGLDAEPAAGHDGAQE
jgi:hypothetical protein